MLTRSMSMLGVEQGAIPRKDHLLAIVAVTAQQNFGDFAEFLA